MSTIPGGCFVAPDSLRRLNQIQKQHAREAKEQATKSSVAPDTAHIQSPPALSDNNKTSLTHMISMAPIRLSELWSRSQPSPPVTPPLSPIVSRSPATEPVPITEAKLENNNKEISNPIAESH